MERAAPTVVVNGLPGSGKSTLARDLAAELGLPLFSKDAVKETLADALATARPPGLSPLEWSRALGAAAAEALWTLLGDARGRAVLESPWLAHLRPVAAAGLARAGVPAEQVVEVWCAVPPALARARFAERAGGRHAVHVAGSGSADEEWRFWERNARPLAFGTVHRVDTTRPVDVPELARLIADGGTRPV
ncbi:AAA family ATPase [Streptomyces litchfieldiae]|uniref:AAA family ATPase n=1 Tax=Streptomyces litchfieldiae TaxID=3075543 RepID=A0ABU2MXD2_9ACTN|nr:AAA family ATPase [Streptomyces sp. DSM 44938]MDT0346275.1 AAA family ATPase [Streptomyces sp. DSM 44938]